MNIAEAQLLLTMAASFDNRKPDADAAKAWAAALDDLRFIDCRDALIEHYKTSTEWLMPATIRASVKKIRGKRIDAFGHYDVPSGLNARQTLDFLRTTDQRIADGEITDPTELATPDLKPRYLPDMKALLPSPNEDR